jgi:hypothetical protein
MYSKNLSPKHVREKTLQNEPAPNYGEGDVLTLTFVSVFSVLVAGDGFTIVVLVSFFSVFSAGGLFTVVSFCSQAASKTRPANRQMYFFIQVDRIREPIQSFLRRGSRRRGRRRCFGRAGGRSRFRRRSRTWRGGFSLLFACREQRGASQNADVFLHIFRLRPQY